MAPITWKNINSPNVTLGQAGLSHVASQSFGAAEESLKGILQNYETNYNKRWDAQKQQQTDAATAEVRQETDINKLLNMDASDYVAKYDDQFDQKDVAAAILKQKGVITDDLIATGRTQLSQEYMSEMDRRNAIKQRLIDVNVPVSMRAGITSSIMSESADQRAGIKTAAKQQTMSDFYQNFDPTAIDAELQLQIGKEQYGDLFDLEGGKGHLEAAQTAQFNQMYNAITQQAGGNVIAGSAVIKNLTGKVTPAMQSRLMNNYLKVNAKNIPEQQLQTLNVQRYELQQNAAKAKAIMPLQIKAAGLKRQQEQFGTENGWIAAAQASASNLEGKNPRQIIDEQSTNWLKWTRVDVNDVEKVFTSLNKAGLNNNEANQVLLDIASTGIMIDGNLNTLTQAANKRATRIQAAKEINSQYDNAMTNIATMTQEYDNNTRQVANQMGRTFIQGGSGGVPTDTFISPTATRLDQTAAQKIVDVNNTIKTGIPKVITSIVSGKRTKKEVIDYLKREYPNSTVDTNKLLTEGIAAFKKKNKKKNKKKIKSDAKEIKKTNTDYKSDEFLLKQVKESPVHNLLTAPRDQNVMPGYTEMFDTDETAEKQTTKIRTQQIDELTTLLIKKGRFSDKIKARAYAAKLVDADNAPETEAQHIQKLRDKVNKMGMY